MRFALFFASALLCCAAALTPHAGASVSVALSLADLMERADEVALGHATASQARWEGRRIVTDVTVVVDERIYGGAGGRLTLQTLGGAVGDIGMRVEGSARLPVGHRAIVFARRQGGVLRTVAMSQGVLPVRSRGTGDVVMPGGAGQALMQRLSNGLLAPGPGAVLHERPLGDVMSELHALAASR